MTPTAIVWGLLLALGGALLIRLDGDRGASHDRRGMGLLGVAGGGEEEALMAYLTASHPAT